MADKAKGANTAPLEGIKVIEITQWAAAPGAAVILGDFGADVVKIEHPVRGDGWRGIMSSGAIPIGDVNYPWEQDNRNKRGMTLDISNADAQEIFRKIIGKSDVFLTNLRPNELKRYHLEYETLVQYNPKLIYANLTGYGRKGPERERPGYDYTAFWARSGFQSVIKEPDRPPIFQRGAMGDHVASIAMACGIITALYYRERTGVGQEVDVSLLGTGCWVLSFDIMAALVTGQYAPPRKREEMLSMVNVYRTKDDKWIMMMHLQPDPYWPKFCKAMGIEHLVDNPEYSTLFARLAHEAELIPMVEGIMASKTLEEWKKIMDECGLIYAPVQEPTEVAKDEQAWANDNFLKFEHPILGSMTMVNNPMRLSATPGSIRRPAPEFNQHTEEVLLEFGFDWDDIAKFKDKKLIA